MLDDVLYKKAMGFMVEEVTLDYERAKVNGYLFCPHKKRLYTSRGFIRAKINKGKLEIDDKLKFIKFFAPKPKKTAKKGAKTKIYTLKK